ncbi:MAG: ATPase, T2SS/T4P/T4SS family [Planctomycetota bacterium]
MSRHEIYLQTTRRFLQPVIHLLDDPDVSEVLINGPNDVYAERFGKLTEDAAKFDSEAELMAAARNIAEFAGRPLQNQTHSVDARLPDGSRVHVILPPSSRNGVCISIRKFNTSSLSLQNLIQKESLTEESARFLSEAVHRHDNVVVSGGTGSGKTSLLNALSAEIDPTERIVVIEDSTELQLKQPHTVYLEAQPADRSGADQVTIRDLFVDSLRMRPDRILVGEVRRGEALDLIQSMISGHRGSLTTVHASTPRDALIRLETLSLMGGVQMPPYVARTQVASAIDVIVQIARLPDGSRKVIQIDRCLGLTEGEVTSADYQLEAVYRTEPTE